ncbi:MAG: hypothetical protein HYX92_20010 [Chloroflexi bacterium]|nr:hypothetical protein [Chloroflexota bacterium]
MRRLVFLVMAGAFLLSLSMPSPAVADGKATRFTASGVVAVAGVPRPSEIEGHGRRLEILTEGELVAGYLAQSTWGTLLGGVFSTLHKSEVAYLPNGKFRGELEGGFSVGLPGGILSGKMKGEVTGTFMWTDTNGNRAVDASEAASLFIQTIHDVGTWKATGGTGVFAGTKSEGTWTVDLTWGVFDFDGPGPMPPMPTLTGPISLKGVHQERSRDDD